MEFKGTKGKWTLYKTNKGHYKLSGEKWINFCKIYAITKDNSFEDDKETQANALLISKAPEMLELLTQLRDTEDFGIAEVEQITELIKQATEL